jgi:hypothetical protein
MPSRPALEQAVMNSVGLARTLIRKRHSIQADEEVNELIPRIRIALMGQAQDGRVEGLSDAELLGLIRGTFG